MSNIQITVRWLLVSTMFAMLYGCGGLGQLGQGLADGAPPASPPTVVLKDNTKTCTQYSQFLPPRKIHYSGLYRFTVEVDSNILNKLTVEHFVRGLGKYVLLTDFNSAQTQPSDTTYIRENISGSVDSGRTKDRITIVAPAGGWTPDRDQDYYFVEKSPNAKFTGTNQALALTSIKLEAISQPNSLVCRPPPRPPTPPVAEISSPSVIGMGSIPARKVLEDLGFIVVAYNFTNVVDSSVLVVVTQSPAAGPLPQGSKIELSVGLSTRPASDCPTSPATPAGNPVSFLSCVACPSGEFAWNVKDVAQPACNQEDSTAIVQNGNCTCTVIPGVAVKLFSICAQCPNEAMPRRDPAVRACTETQALDIVRKRNDACVVTSCP